MIITILIIKFIYAHINFNLKSTNKGVDLRSIIIIIIFTIITTTTTGTKDAYITGLDIDYDNNRLSFNNNNIL